MLDKFEIIRQANPVVLIDLCALLAGNQSIHLRLHDKSLFVGTVDEFYAWEEAEQYLDYAVEFVIPAYGYVLKIEILP